MIKEAFYTTVENQVRDDGSYGLLYDHFYGENAYSRALAKYYSILAAAAISGIPYHAGMIIEDSGAVIEKRVFDRRVLPETEVAEAVGTETAGTNEETEETA